MALGIAGVAAFFLNSCSTTPAEVVVPLEIPGAHYVGNKACMDCHKEIVREFPASPTRGFILKMRRWSAKPAANPATVRAANTSSPAATQNSSSTRATIPTSCFQCHLDVQAEFNLPQHHPVIEGHMSCVQCHDPHGGDIFKPKGGLAMARQNESCAQCHREQTRPFVFEHEALREGCAVCHNPHGSINEKMLVESDPNLCLRCHAQVQANVPAETFYIGNMDHTPFLQMGTCWTAGCHTAIHGSNVDPC